MYKYYVYILLDQRCTGFWKINKNKYVKYKPFYVGKGCNYRVIQHFAPSVLNKDNNLYKVRTIRKIKETLKENPKYIKLYTNLTEEAALKLETETILFIRKNYQNTLTNILDGGNQPPTMFGKNNPKAKTIYQFTLDGKFIKEWNCIMDAAKEYNLNHSHISSAANMKDSSRRQCGGFLWSYTKTISQTYNGKYTRIVGKIVAFNDSETIEFNSIKNAYFYLGVKKIKGT